MRNILLSFWLWDWMELNRGRRRATELGVVTPRNVWSAARLQGKSEGAINRSAQMYSAFKWRAVSPGHDELRCVLFLINGTVIEDHLREQVASTPLGTVRSS